LAGLSLEKMNTSITYYGQPTLPRVAATYTLNDLHEHLGQPVSYAPGEPERAAVEQEGVIYSSRRTLMVGLPATFSRGTYTR